RAPGTPGRRRSAGTGERAPGAPPIDVAAAPCRASERLPIRRRTAQDGRCARPARFPVRRKDVMNDDPAAAAPTLIYSPGTCAFAELVLLQWLGLPHRLCRVTRDERKGERFRAAINPQGQVPVLLEDGDVLTENAAILLQLADRFPGSGMAPAAGTRERYELYRWLSWLDSGFHAAHSPWFAPQRFVDDPSLYETVRARALRQIAEQLAVLERQLAG